MTDNETPKSWGWRTGTRILEAMGLKAPIEKALQEAITQKSNSRISEEMASMRSRSDEFCADMNHACAESEIAATILTFDDSPFFEDCRAALETQTLIPSQIIVINNVSPFSLACQNALDEVDRQYYVHIDEDMILAPDCIERLYGLIKTHDNCAEVVGGLDDPILEMIYGVHMYDAQAAKAIGFHPLEDDKGCERRMTASLKSASYRLARWRESLGQHHPKYLPHEAFWKFRFEGEKIRYYGKGTADFESIVQSITNYRTLTGDDAARYALAGLFIGMQEEDISGELTLEGRKADPTFLRVSKILEGIRD